MIKINSTLLIKFLNKETNEEESQRVLHWLEENNLSQEELNKIAQNPEYIWIYEDIDAKNDWEKIKEKFKQPTKSIPLFYYIKIAAASLLLFISISGSIFYINNKIKNSENIVYNYGNSILYVTLPDNSEVSLNNNSKLIYKNNFLENREITIDGQIYFEVKRNVHKPFVIHTLQNSVKVLGTTFLVTTDKYNTKVDVTSGKVAFYCNQQKCDTLFLTKGETGIYNPKAIGLIYKTKSDLNFLSWQNRNLQFINTPMENVVQDLEQYFKIKISVTNPKIYKLKYTTEFRNPRLNNILKEMELVLNIKTVQIGDNVKITINDNQ